ncbi:MAG: flagellar motor protein MotB [Bacteroidetes bacterium]|nr:MAG: flagellar motor protein MotB [Bacteroidota bacterium]
MSTGLIIILCVLLLAVVVVQIGKVTELATRIRGEEEVQMEVNSRNGALMLVFMVAFLAFCFWSAYKFKNWMLGYGPHEAASAHGGALDGMFNTTVIITGIVFVLTQVALFYFAWKYRGRKGHTADFVSHDDRLEIIWTAIPAVVMCFLVIKGLVAWNTVMADIPETAVSSLTPVDAGATNADGNEEFIEIEATGAQFLWYLRYPGPDGKLGARDYTKITGLNPLGQVWTDDKNLDDFQPSEIVLPVNKKVRVRITSRDVLHNFALPHFRVKMDAVPGMPTYFVFTPTTTTEEYRERLRNYPEYQRPSDPNDPESDPLWKTFNFELACMELCGKGHFSMRKVVKIVSEDEYKEWLSQQQSYYLSSIRGTDEDPRKDELLDFEIIERKKEFDAAVEKALSAQEEAERIIRLKYVNFETGSAKLTRLSRYELDNLADFLKLHPNIKVEIAGHTDNTGDPEQNQALSQDRANAVMNYLIGKGINAAQMVAVGYGSTQPLDTNDTEEGRANNRRTEFKILAQ